eukprot:3917254-Ditylum_brightwellii.AAC.1
MGNISPPRGAALSPIAKMKGSKKRYHRKSKQHYLRADFLNPAPSALHHQNRKPCTDVSVTSP